MTPKEKLFLYAERVHLTDEDIAYLSSLLREAYERAAQKAELFEDRIIATAIESLDSPLQRRLAQEGGRGISSAIRALAD